MTYELAVVSFCFLLRDGYQAQFFSLQGAGRTSSLLLFATILGQCALLTRHASREDPLRDYLPRPGFPLSAGALAMLTTILAPFAYWGRALFLFRYCDCPDIRKAGQVLDYPIGEASRLRRLTVGRSERSNPYL